VLWAIARDKVPTEYYSKFEVKFEKAEGLAWGCLMEKTRGKNLVLLPTPRLRLRGITVLACKNHVFIVYPLKKAKCTFL
jgi:hypothetical protein